VPSQDWSIRWHEPARVVPDMDSERHVRWNSPPPQTRMPLVLLMTYSRSYDDDWVPHVEVGHVADRNEPLIPSPVHALSAPFEHLHEYCEDDAIEHVPPN